MGSTLRAVIAYALLGALALGIGYFLTSPLELSSFAGMLLVAFLLVFPLLMRWHHVLLVATWNAAFIIWFLPGQPSFWMIGVLLSIFFTASYHLLSPGQVVPQAPSVTKALVALALVVVITAAIRGGVGLRSLGSNTYGGKHYFHILFAIAGYFALASTPIPPHRARFYAGLFILVGATAIVSQVIFYLGSGFYFLYAFFPTNLVNVDALQVYAGPDMLRIVGLAPAGTALCFFMLMRYGIKGMVDLSHPWRLLFFLGALTAGLYSGFRSVLLLVGLTVLVQFYLEKLFASRLFLVCLAIMALSASLLIPFASKLPLTIQRTLTLLPLDLDLGVRMNAEASTEWRLEMWKRLLPELPKYALLGKGYGFSADEMYLTRQSVHRGGAQGFDLDLYVGDYHNGPLSLYIPFGLPGVAAFSWLVWVALRALYRNYRYGPPELRTTNTFLLSLATAKLLFFCFAFGAISQDLQQFAGIVGMSVALNHGVCSAEGNAESAEQLNCPSSTAEEPAEVLENIGRPGWRDQAETC